MYTKKEQAHVYSTIRPITILPRWESVIYILLVHSASFEFKTMNAHIQNALQLNTCNYTISIYSTHHGNCLAIHPIYSIFSQNSNFKLHSNLFGTGFKCILNCINSEHAMKNDYGTEACRAFQNFVCWNFVSFETINNPLNFTHRRVHSFWIWLSD